MYKNNNSLILQLYTMAPVQRLHVALHSFRQNVPEEGKNISTGSVILYLSIHMIQGKQILFTLFLAMRENLHSYPTHMKCNFKSIHFSQDLYILPITKFKYLSRVPKARQFCLLL